MKTRKIEVYFARKLLIGLLGIVIFLAIVMFLDVTNHPSKSQEQIAALSVTICLPCGLLALGLLSFKVSLEDDIITIRRWYGRKVKFHMDEITKIIFIPANIPEMDNQRLKIYSGKRHVTIEGLMVNYIEMKERILENVDQSIIETKIIRPKGLK